MCMGIARLDSSRVANDESNLVAARSDSAVAGVSAGSVAGIVSDQFHAGGAGRAEGAG